MIRPQMLLLLILLAAPRPGLPSSPPVGEADRATPPPASVEPTAAAAEPEVIARVNGEPLYVEDVGSVLGELHRSASPEERVGFDLDQLLFRLVNDTLLAQEARALGVDRDESMAGRSVALRERMATARLEKEEIQDRIRLDPEELERVYREAFRTITLRIATRKELSDAETLLREVREGADLERLARERSEDPYAMRGGLVEDIARVDLPAPLADLAFALAPGELGGPVATGLGWTVFRVEALAEADPERYEGRQGSVRNVLRLQQREALRAQLLDRLRATHEVVVHREVLDGIEAQRMPDGRLVPRVGEAEAVAIEAGGREVTAAEVGQALASRWAGVSNPDVALAMTSILVDSLAVDALMTAEALRRGYDRAPEVDRAVHAMETRLLVKRYLDEVLGPRVEVATEELRGYYDEHRDEFRKPPRLFVSQLTVPTREEAERLAELVRAGTEFAWLARRHSHDRFRDAGGSIGWVEANRAVTGFEAQLATAQAGDLLGPEGGQGDWRLLHVGAVEDQGHYEFEEVSGNVRARLRDRRFLELLDDTIGKLRQRSEIWINDEAVAALRIDAVPTESEGAAPGHGGR